MGLLLRFFLEAPEKTQERFSPCLFPFLEATYIPWDVALPSLSEMAKVLTR